MGRARYVCLAQLGPRGRIWGSMCKWKCLDEKEQLWANVQGSFQSSNNTNHHNFAIVSSPQVVRFISPPPKTCKRTRYKITPQQYVVDHSSPPALLFRKIKSKRHELENSESVAVLSSPLLLGEQLVIKTCPLPRPFHLFMSFPILTSLFICGWNLLWHNKFALMIRLSWDKITTDGRNFLPEVAMCPVSHS